ncbi:MAG TPA: response regulator [bacterium]|nr:response regulator [bacterium]
MQSGQKIFILDTDINYVSPLSRGFEQAGFQVFSWDEKKKPIEMIKQLKPDLVISEVDLSEVDSYELFKKVRAIPDFMQLPFIFVSNEKQVDERIKNIEVGVDDYITKPFYVEEVVSRAKNLLDEIAGMVDTHIQNQHGFAGNLDEMNLVDLIQTMELGKKSATIKLKHNGVTGTVFVANGEVVDASLSNSSADQALMRMFTWTTGSFMVKITDVNPDRKLEKSNKQLIEIGLRRINDWEKIKQGLPPLNAMVIRSDHNNYEILSEEEIELIKSVKDKTRLCNLIEKCRFDDLKALELVRGLHQKGYLKESEDNYSLYVDDYLNRIKHYSSADHPPSERINSIVSNLLKKSVGDSEYFEEKKDDRRQLSDRRRLGRRNVDRLQQGNPIYLSKAELLMLKEALS